MSNQRTVFPIKRGRVFNSLKLEVEKDPDNIVTGTETVTALAKPIKNRSSEIPDDSVPGIPLTVTWAGDGWVLSWTEAETEALTSDYYVVDCRIDLTTGPPHETAVTLSVSGRVTGLSA